MTYYSERIESKVNQENRYMGLRPEEAKARQRQPLRADKSSELSAISKDWRQKLEF